MALRGSTSWLPPFSSLWEVLYPLPRVELCAIMSNISIASRAVYCGWRSQSHLFNGLPPHGCRPDPDHLLYPLDSQPRSHRWVVRTIRQGHRRGGRQLHPRKLPGIALDDEISRRNHLGAHPQIRQPSSSRNGSSHPFRNWTTSPSKDSNPRRTPLSGKSPSRRKSTPPFPATIWPRSPSSASPGASGRSSGWQPAPSTTPHCSPPGQASSRRVRSSRDS